LFEAFYLIASYLLFPFLCMLYVCHISLWLKSLSLTQRTAVTNAMREDTISGCFSSSLIGRLECLRSLEKEMIILLTVYQAELKSS